ncbi:MAG: hypothetical protein AAGG01_23385, partial [Planctomycetota bacterium]
VAGFSSPWQERAWFTFYLGTFDERPGIARAVERSLELMARLCRSPFLPDRRPPDVFASLLTVEDESWSRLMEAPDDVFLSLESAARRSNDETLIAMALDTALGVDERWSLDQLILRTAPFARLLRLLGVLSGAQQRSVLTRGIERFAGDQGRDLGELAELVQRIDELGIPSGSHPVPRKVRLHLNGERTLSPDQVSRQEQKLRRAWPDLALPCLRHDVIQELMGAVTTGAETLSPAEVEALPEGLIHALMIQAGLDWNRRSLRRVLRAVLDGDVAFLAKHPNNVAWLNELKSRVSAQAAEAWAVPPKLTVEVEGLGEVSLCVEQRPLEALRMGTYVGSCFGVGGSFRYVAAAVVMDANKQVVFARDARGVFLARQIICVSDGWHLFCSYVYPDQEKGTLLDAFLRYDALLAEATGLSLGTDADEDDESIECLVAEGSWFDGVLDPTDER